ncbi:hypothetical protein TanjilG_08357 [Lupinus angustifolius]|uniref:DUF506 family protein n=1 Tax=Lupinus angustifolius TaxID=3871 RepID=A0A1J7HLD3_LUPAN|nr:PREDICTED: uncharacterized protein LOC109354919 [Lupinus angustifolius]OIW07242.1 hypothetical protein TanjilG_08357 [Lupinus angustifolius]
MPPMKIQPIDIDTQKLKDLVVVRNDAVKPVLKSRLRRLFVFDRQFQKTTEKTISGAVVETPQSNKDVTAGSTIEFEPSSVCLAEMVRSFIEESNEKQQHTAAIKCGRNRCNCFKGNGNDSSDEELDIFGIGFDESVSSSSFGDASDTLKSFIPCASAVERNLLADTSKIVEKNSKVIKRKDELRKIVTESLLSLGYDSSICKSKWDKTLTYLAGEYEYIDVIVEGERLIIDIDFRSEFEIARSTVTYKAILQSLPCIFVGKSDRLCQIVTAVSEAAKQNLKKKGMHVPSWRKAEYMMAKWLSSSCVRVSPLPLSSSSSTVDDTAEKLNGVSAAESDCGQLELIFGEKITLPEAVSGEKSLPIWKPPAVKVKSVERRVKVVTGLASLLKDKP